MVLADNLSSELHSQKMPHMLRKNSRDFGRTILHDKFCEPGQFAAHISQPYLNFGDIKPL